MRCIKSIEELEKNMLTLDSYLLQKHEPEYSFTIGLIKKGICFAAVSQEDGYHFYPSRFIGYANNSKDAHENNDAKDGRETNPVITSLLGRQIEDGPEFKRLEKAYREYCEQLEFVANDSGAFGVKRKYWLFGD